MHLYVNHNRYEWHCTWMLSVIIYLMICHLFVCKFLLQNARNLLLCEIFICLINNFTILCSTQNFTSFYVPYPPVYIFILKYHTEYYNAKFTFMSRCLTSNFHPIYFIYLNSYFVHPFTCTQYTTP